MFSKTQVLIAFALSGIIVAVVLVFVLPSCREVERISTLKFLDLGVSNYNVHHGSAPPAFLWDAAGRRGHSWRVLLLPYIDHPTLYDEYRMDLSWSAPENAMLLDRMPDEYRSPTAGRQPDSVTNYLAVVGHDTLWPPGRCLSTKEWIEFPTDTVLLVEDLESSVEWTEPVDLELDQAMAHDGPFRRPGGALCLFRDGSVRLVGPDVDPDVLESMLTRGAGAQEE